MTRRITVVLDDDPTGTQSARDVPVLLDPEAELTQVPGADDAVYVLTNTRAMEEDEAVVLLRRVRARIDATGVRAEYVLRGDSTLRGHVFAESDVFAGDVLLFVPAFPAGGRTTVDGVHYVTVDGRRRVAADTEFAADPVFGYRARTLPGWVREIGGRDAYPVGLAALRADGPDAVARALCAAPAGTVVVPDAETDNDLAVISAGLDRARAAGRRVTLRCAAPLAAMRAGRHTVRSVSPPARCRTGGTLVVCGSHTDASSRQLAALSRDLKTPVHTVSTTAALSDPDREGARLAATLGAELARGAAAIVASERTRRAEHGDLRHGARVMRALCGAVAPNAGRLAAVIAKGGITSAEVARHGLGARTARVVGPLLPGIAVWEVPVPAGAPIPYAVVPGNVGGERTLVDIAHVFGLI